MTDPLVDDLRTAIRERNAAVIVGAGASIQASGNPQVHGFPVASWVGLLRSGLRRCRDLGESPTKVAAMESLLEAGELLLVAEFVTDKLGGSDGGEFATWLQDTVGQLTPVDDSVPKALGALDVPLLTTNYDLLLEWGTGRPTITWKDGSAWQAVAKRADAGIVHLHGSYDRPSSVVLGVQSYAGILGDAKAQNALRALASTRRLVLVGFGAGIADPNFSRLRTFLKEVLSDSQYRHFRLVREEDLDEARQEHEQGERIVPLSHGRGFESLAPFLRSLAPVTAPRPAGPGRGAREPRRVLEVEISGTQVCAGVPGGQRVSEELRLDRVRLETVKLLDEWLRFQDDPEGMDGDTGRSHRSSVAKVLGSVLFDSVFTGKVKRLYREQLRSARPGNPLSLVLKVNHDWLRLLDNVASMPLTALPWELLCDFEDRGYLSTSPLLTLSRTYATDDAGDWVPPRTLRVFVAVAQPEELLGQVRREWEREGTHHGKSYDELVQEVVETVRSVQSDPGLDVREPGIGTTGTDQPATWDFVRCGLTATPPPHIVHYIGHGRRTTSGNTGEVAFLGLSGNSVDWRSFGEFAAEFETSEPPILVFLHLCQRPRMPDPREDARLAHANFGLLAFELIQRRVQMVVAMQYPATADIGAAFTRKFYELIKEKTVAEAVQEARRSVSRMGPHFGPVLYQRGQDGLIVSRTAETASPDPGPAGDPAPGRGLTPRELRNDRGGGEARRDPRPAKGWSAGAGARPFLQPPRPQPPDPADPPVDGRHSPY